MTRDKFLEEMSGDNNHRLLLWEALEETKGQVVEYGAGHGSTKYLKQYCKDNKRKFLTFDNGKEWAKIHGSKFVEDWGVLNPTGSVILIDHAPGERRVVDIELLKDNFEIIVIHDTEPIGAGDYKYETIWHLFKYRVDVKTDGAWATAVSNTIDVSKWAGKEYKEYKIS